MVHVVTISIQSFVLVIDDNGIFYRKETALRLDRQISITRKVDGLKKLLSVASIALHGFQAVIKDVSFWPTLHEFRPINVKAGT